MSNTVEITSTGQVLVTEVAQQVIELQTPAAPATVEVQTQGPQGATAVYGLGALSDVDISGKVNQSVLYYDAASGKWKGDSLETILTLTDGGNF